MRFNLVVVLLCTIMLGKAQHQFQGVVTDAVTYEPLAFATVQGVGTATGTQTEADGVFYLQTSADTIKVSYIGYESVRISPKKGQYVEIQLRPKAFLLNNVPTIVGTASPIALNTLAPITNIEQSHLLRDNETTIAPALNRVPGVFMHSGALNTNRITIRGIGNRSPFSTTKIRAYLDDIPLTSGIGETTLEDIDLSILDQVQVWKGPTASTYGAGLGGMIHLKTKTQEQASPTSVKYNSLLGSYGLFRNVVDANAVHDKGDFNVHLNYANTHSDGYRENNSYDRETLTLLAKAKIGKTNESSLIINYINLKAFIPSSLNQTDFDNEPRKAAFTWAQVMGFEDTEKVLIGLSNKAFLVRGRNFKLYNTTSLFSTYRNSYESRPFNILRENNQAIGARTKFSYFHNRKVGIPNIVLGFEGFLEDYNWQTYETNGGQLDTLLSDNEENRKFFNLFAEANYEFGKRFFTTIGFNFNQTKYVLQDFYLRNGDISGDYTFDLIFSPRLSLGYHLSPRSTLFATLSHGFSPPTLEETLAPDGTINPEIQPEKGWNFELGARGKYLNSRFSFDVSLYSMRIEDLLVARRTAQDQFVGVNAGKTIHNGLEAYFQYHVMGYNSPLNIFISYTYSHYQFDEFVDGESDFSGNDLTGTAPHLLAAGIDYRPAKGFYANLNYQFVDAMPMRDDNSIFSEAYQLINLRVGYNLNIKSKFLLELYGGINNAFDEKYASMLLINAGSFGGQAPRYFYPGLPRNYYGGVSLKYIFGKGNR